LAALAADPLASLVNTAYIGHFGELHAFEIDSGIRLPASNFLQFKERPTMNIK
jgi:hypothetical protein